MSSYLNLMAWNEILARIFTGFETQRNLSPEWLINPGTRRRLKLDVVYPEVGIAVRFAGLQAKGQGRKSDWEELEDESRDEVRKELCRQHGFELLLLNPNEGYPEEQFKEIAMVLGDASRRLAQNSRFQGKAALLERLSKSRKQLEEIRRRVRRSEDLAGFAELWRDREAQETAAAQAAAQAAALKSNGRKTPVKLARLEVGTEVMHQHHGTGTVTQVDSRADDVYLTIQFVTAGERRFAASLVADKLAVVKR